MPEISCGINHGKSYYIEKKEMKHCLSFVTTKLAAQHPPDLPDSIFLMYLLRESRIRHVFLTVFSRVHNHTHALHNCRSETETQSR